MCDRIHPTGKCGSQRFVLVLFMFPLFSYVLGPAIVPAKFPSHSSDIFTLQQPPSWFPRVTTPPSATLGKGRFLVASRDLLDPNFSESVILLLDYNEKGALGIIINHPTHIALAKLLPGVKALRKRKEVVHIGGPVARDMVMILTQTTHPPQTAQQVFANIYLLSQQTELEQVLQSDGKQTKLRMYVGYAGWAAGQLDMEVARGGWLIVPADAALIFDKAPSDVWPELIRRGEAQWTFNSNCGLRIVDCGL